MHAPWWATVGKVQFVNYCQIENEIAKMSEYYKTLPPVAKDRYLDKLSLMSVKEGDDPYANDWRFVDDMTLWPPVEYGHIFCYFIQRPGVYTQQQEAQRFAGNPDSDLTNMSAFKVVAGF